ncbi:MAG: permease-like cell division protein FtsX [Patescibacteria group bacterium]
MFTTFKRIIKLGLQNFWRNRWLESASILVLALTLLITTVSVVYYFTLRSEIASLKDKIDLTAYFDDKVPDAEILDLKIKLQTRSDVSGVTFISKEEALRIWQSRPISKRVKDLVVPQNNPLPRSLVVKTADPVALQQIAGLLTSEPFKDKVRRVSYQENKLIIEQLLKVADNARKNGIVFSTTFIVIALIVIFNTVKLAILTRTEEVEIMRLVGASGSYIKVPFFVEAALVALVATVISIAVLLLALRYQLPIVPFFLAAAIAGGSADVTGFVSDRFFWIILGQLLAGLVLVTLATFWSLRKHFRY